MSIRKGSTSSTNASFSVSKPGPGGLIPPVVSQVIYTDSNYNTIDDLAIGLTGGYARILGSNFYSGISIYLNGTQVSSGSITVVSSSEVRCILPAASLGYYTMMLFNANSVGYVKPNSFYYSPFPTYNTPITLVLNNASLVSQPLSASGDAPLSFTVVSGTLPTGLTMSSSGLLSGTVSGYTTLTTGSFTIGVDDAQYQTVTQVISWSVSVGDLLFSGITTLLSADSTSQAASFINDASINNNQLTVVADARAQSFHPYQPGYYSVGFTGASSQWLSFPAGANTSGDLGAGDFTIESWIYLHSRVALYPTLFDNSTSSSRLAIWLGHNSVDTTKYNVHVNGVNISSTTVIAYGVWTHFAVVRSGTTIKMYVNGVAEATTTTSSANLTGVTTAYVGGSAADAGNCGMNGQVSNFRIVKGTALYTSTFTPGTSPLLPITNTTLLLCRSNRYIDNSPLNSTITASGSPVLKSAHPFSTAYQVGTQYYSVQMNGSGNYVSVPGGNSGFAFGTDDLTIEGWVFSQSGNAFTLFDNRTGTTSVNIAILLNTTTIGVYIGGSSFVINGPTFNVGTWYHIAVVRIAGNMKLYVNGTQSGSTYASSQNFTSVSGQVCIGGGYPTGTNSPLTGLVSNVRVVKGLGVYTGNFTVPTSPLTATQSAGTNISAITAGQTVLLTCQDNIGVDNSSSTQTVSINGTANPVSASPFTPSNYTSTLVPTTYGSGYFDGTGDYLTLPASPAFTFGTGDLTIEFWIYAQTNTAGVFDLRNAVVQLAPFIYMTSQQMVWFVSGVNQITSSTLLLNTWYHVAVCRYSGVTKMYLNGVLTGTPYTDANNYISNTPYIGGAYNFSQMTTGYISDLRVVKGTALYTSNFVPKFTGPLSNVTNTQLLTLQYNGSHNNNAFTDNSTFNNVITRTGNVTNGTFSPYGDNFSYYLNGTTDYLTLAADPLTSNNVDSTIEFWIYVTATPSTRGFVFNSVGGTVYAVTITAATNPQLSFWHTSYGGLKFTTSGSITQNAWHHIALTHQYTGGNVKFFIDGVLDATTGTGYTTMGGGSGFYIGTYNVSINQFFPGYISNFRITQGQILYTGNFTPSTAPLTNNSVGTTGANVASSLTGTVVFLTGQSNRFTDNSFKNYAITSAGTPQVQKFSPFSTITVPKYYSSYFGTKTDVMSITSTPAITTFTGDFTLECWVYPTDASQSGSAWGVFDARSSGQTAVPWAAGLDTYSSGWLMNYWNGTAYLGTIKVQTNTWTHCAWVRSGTTLTFYTNGVAGGTGTLSGTQTGGNTTLQLGTKDNNLSGYGTLGYISNARIVNGIAVYTGNFTPSTSPLTRTQSAGTNIAAITGSETTLLLCQNNTMVDSSVNAYNVTASSTTLKIVPFSPFTSTPGPATPYTPSTFGGSMYFDGTGDYLTLPSTSTASLLTAGAFTWETWIYPIAPTATGVNVVLYGIWNNGSNQWAFEYSHGGLWSLNARIIMYVGNYGSNESAKYSTTQLPLYTWSHIAWVRTSANALSVYVNGVSQTLSAYNSGLTWSDSYSNTTGSACGIGGASGYSGFQGYLADMRYTQGVAAYTNNFIPTTSPLTQYVTVGATNYNSALLMNNANPGIYDQSRSLNIESVADTKVTNFGPYNGSNYSVYLNGTSDYIDIANDASNQLSGATYSMEMWLYPTVGGVERRIFNKNGASTYGWLLSISAADVITFRTDSTFMSGGSLTAPAGQWTHIAVTHDGTTTRIFVNGQLSTSATGVTITNANEQSMLRIGARAYQTGTYFFTGYMSNIRLVKGTAIYTSAFTPSTSPLGVVSGTSLLTCQSNKFVDNSTNNFTITTAGTPKVATQNPFQINTGLSYYFDGTGDGLLFNGGVGVGSIPSGAGTAFTVEFWIYPTSALTFLRPNGNGSSLSISTNASNQIIISNTFASDFMTTTNAVKLNQWNHVAVTRTTANLYSVYIDGVSAGTPVTYATSLGLQAQYYIGYNTYNGASYVMYVADLRITNGAVRYTTSFAPPITPFLLK